MTFFFFILLGLLPSVVWLVYYLKKDVHPEPKGMVLKIFLWGMLAAPVAAAIEIALSHLLGFWNDEGSLKIVLWNFLGIALIEESAKYSVVRRKIVHNKEFDEPIDAMVYLVIAALGFAALENVLILVGPLITNYFSSINPGIKSLVAFELTDALQLSLIRFWGATLLHTLASGALGFFLALSFYHHGRFKYHWLILPTGLVIATLLHGFFNYLILLIGATGGEGGTAWGYFILLMGLLVCAAYAVNKSFTVLKSRWAQSEINLK